MSAGRFQPRSARSTFPIDEVIRMQINKQRILAPAIATLALAIVSAPLATDAQQSSSPSSAQDQSTAPSSTVPDNSARNKTHANTADNQKENTSDREITRKIRRSITSESSLSTYAHNVKIITQGGQVTLKGPVRDENEKQTIASKAADVAGADKVNNQLTVKQ
jgi:hyperosmotically inducible protein